MKKSKLPLSKPVRHFTSRFSRLLVIFYFLFFILYLEAQSENINVVQDAFINIATDARSAGLADIGVATNTDAFSQFWNPSKYVFSTKKSEIAINQIFVNKDQLKGFSQLSVLFYNTIDNRSSYSLSFRNYSFTVDDFIENGTTSFNKESSIDAAYTLRLSKVFSMSVAGRFTVLSNKTPLINSFLETSSNLYGVDVSGFYNGNEIAYTHFNGRWRAGFNFSNLRGKSSIDNTDIEIYAPSVLKIGAGFDFIFNQDNTLAITSEYKKLLESYTENEDGEPLKYGLQGSVAALGFEYVTMEKIILRTGYSQGIHRPTDTFGSIGLGFRTDYASLDLAILLGQLQKENLARKKLRVSISLDLAAIF